MPRPRRQSNTVSLPSGGTSADLSHLSTHLGLPLDVCAAIMTCQGMGVRSGETGDTTTSSTMDNVWGDWMNEAMGATTTTHTTATTSDAPPSQSETVALAASDSDTTSSVPRSYVLPIIPRTSPPSILAQTGTLDSSLVGRSGIKNPSSHDLDCPTILSLGEAASRKFVFVATSPTACHSVAITEDGQAFGWGRNESGQLGLGYSSPIVPIPTLLSAPEDAKFIVAGVGKYHTILVAKDGRAYASGGNKCGQLGVNNAGLDGCDRFRRCVVADGEEEVSIIHASCGENISALLSSQGHLYTCGSSEYGQLGNGETGEYIVTAGRLGYANCAKFLPRSMFVQSEADEKGTPSSVDAKGRVKCVPLGDSSSIRLGSVTCGKNHLVAVEATSTNGDIPRIFTWGCGDYGCLGHTVQADEYTPRMVGAFRGTLFANNPPVDAAAGSNCTIVQTKNGHVYYMGKHRNVGEATMRPNLIDALANNGHVVTAIGAGSQTVFCSTRNGVTVSWGHGNMGELGYGRDENKSSSKPKFVNGLDSCIVTSLACGMGHTLFLIREDDAEDSKAIEKLPKLEDDDIAQFVEQIKSRKVSVNVKEPPKKKQKGKKG